MIFKHKLSSESRLRLLEMASKTNKSDTISELKDNYRELVELIQGENGTSRII